MSEKNTKINYIVDGTTCLLIVFIFYIIYSALTHFMYEGYTDKVFPITNVVIERDGELVDQYIDKHKIARFCYNDTILFGQEIERLYPLEIDVERIIESEDLDEEFLISYVKKSIDIGRLGVKHVQAEFNIPHTLKRYKAYHMFVRVKYSFRYNLVSRYFPKHTISEKLKFMVEKCKNSG